MSVLVNIADGYRNLVAKLGSQDSKQAYSHFAPTHLTNEDITNAYSTSWAAKKLIDIPAKDSIKRWRTWSASKEQITLIEAEEKKHNIKGKFLRARILSRLRGGACLVFGTGVSDPSLPFNPRELSRGGLKYVTLMRMDLMHPGPVSTDVESPLFGRPEYYLVNGIERVHASRVCVFVGSPLPEDHPRAQMGWGESCLIAAHTALLQSESASANVSSLMFEAKLDIVKIPNFMKNLADRGYEDRVKNRFTLSNLLRSNNSTIILDREEEYEQKVMQFGSLGELMDRYAINLAAAGDIPLTRFQGRSAAGMNATGDGDLSNYYDSLDSAQTLEIDPATSTLNEAIIISALGTRPPEIYHTWRSLWQTTEKERAEIGKISADTIKALSDSKLIPAHTLSRAAVNTMIESGSMPGLEAAVDDLGLGETETKPLDTGSDSSLVADARLMTLYVSRSVVNASEIVDWAKSQGFSDTLAASDLHVTIAYSRTPVDWMKTGQPWEDEVTIPAGGPRVVEKFGDATVLLFSSSMLKWRHESIHENGAIWEYDEYQPHITITWSADAPDISGVGPYTGKIILGPEIYREIDENWKKDRS